MADIQIRLRAVFSDEYFAVLKRVHRAWINVDVRIQFLHSHAQAARTKEAPQTGGRQALTQ